MPASTQTLKPSLPPAVVSTDAIEQLSPYVPNGRDAKVLATAKSRPGRRRSFSISSLGSSTQVIATSCPLIVGDIFAVLTSFLIGSSIASFAFSAQLPGSLVLQCVAITSSYLLMGLAMGLYPATGSSPIWELRQQIFSCFMSFLLVLTLRELQGGFRWLEVVSALCSCLISIVLVPLVRSTTRHHFQRYRWWGESVVIIGSGVQGQAIYNYYDGVRQRGLRPLGIVDSQDAIRDYEPKLRQHIPYLGSIRRLSRIGRRHSVRWGIIAPGGCDGMDMTEVMKYAGNLPNLVILPSQYLLPSLWASPRECAGVMGVHVRNHLRNSGSLVMKRVVDVVCASLGLVVASPIFVIAMLWIKFKSPGPAFYGHSRIGLGGDRFRAWKFRTMVVNADAVLEEYLERDPEMRQQWIEDQKLKNDPRIIPGIGNFLRKSSLDEIPQLWNVLKGEMSLVGPRPIVTNEIEKYRDMYPLYLRVRPGLTGLWQVSGRNNTSYEQRVRLDSYYVCNWSVWLDMYIIVRTIRTILLREGAY